MSRIYPVTQYDIMETKTTGRMVTTMAPHTMGAITDVLGVGGGGRKGGTVYLVPK